MRKSTLFVLLLAVLSITASISQAQLTPIIVARVNKPSQTAPIGTTTIYTPIASGMFRMSVYMELAIADPSSFSSWSMGANWTDDVEGVGTGGLIVLANSGMSSLSGSVLIRAVAGTPITYFVDLGGAPDNSAYSLYIVLERL